jgi:hypothetical protein
MCDADSRRGGDNQHMPDRAGRMTFLGLDGNENKLS